MNQVPTTSLAIQAAFTEALRRHQAGALADAERLYRQVLLAAPRHADSLHFLGVIAYQVHRYGSAVELIGKAIALDDRQPAYFCNLGNAFQALGKFDEAVANFDRALSIRPDLGAHYNRGNALHTQGKLKEAASSYTQALAINPKFAEAHYCHANVLRDQGKLDDALASYDRVLAINPDHALAHNNRGNVLREQGKYDAAAACYDRALSIQSDLVEPHINRGNVLRDQGKLEEAGLSYDRALAINPENAVAYNNRASVFRERGRLEEAVASYRQALALKPDYVDAYNNLASTIIVQGDATTALGIVKQSLQIRESPQARQLFVACIKRLNGLHGDRESRSTVIRALTEPWGRPGDLAGYATTLIMRNPDIASCVTRAVNAWPNPLSAQTLFGTNGIAALASDSLLTALLRSAPVCDADIEHFLTMVRRVVLDKAIASSSAGGQIDSETSLYAALASQCFINEYVFSLTEEELHQANALKTCLVDALDAGTDMPILWIIAVASYFPLLCLPHSERLLEKEWPDEITGLLAQQIREPMEESAIRGTIPRLTDIEGEVSLGVQKQYEEHPYPRWIRVAPETQARVVDKYLLGKFPLSQIERQALDRPAEILIAGCGTGQHSIGTAQRFPDARILAIDLSLGSLAYAKRKTQEVGISSIDYAQANLLQLCELGRYFDVIESVGVLHHLDDPWAGWSTLLSMLRPGGFMKLGLYSRVARQGVDRVRKFIAEQGYGSTSSEIRRFRQHLMAIDRTANAKSSLTSPDFFTISGCRDLFFHVQEHQMKLPEIEAFLQVNHLRLLGFEMDGDLMGAYRLRFPNDRGGTNLEQWQIFEHENPSIFSAMYQFWVQKDS